MEYILFVSLHQRFKNITNYKMKKLVIVMLVLSAGFISCKGEKKEKIEVKDEVKVETKAIVNNVDIASSVLTWKGSKPTGSHNGTVALKEGSLEVKEGSLVGGTFVVDMGTIKNLDIKKEEGAAKLVGHLASDHFFDVAKYPTSKFVITSVAKNEGKLAVTGNLTIKDVTKSITIPASISEANGVTIFKSEVFNIDRADFNVKYGSKKFFDNLKNKFINDLVEMSFEVKTKA